MKKMRKDIGLAQEELASALGTTQRHISEIENGKAAVSWTLMLAFSTFLVQYPQLWQADETEWNTENPAEGARALYSMMTSLKSGL